MLHRKLSVILIAVMVAAACAGGCWAASSNPDLAALQAKLPAFKVIPLPATGTLDLKADQSLTIDMLRGLKLDPNPPVEGPPDKPYELDMTDDLPAGATPAYIAEGILPFRFKYFNNEFNYGGYHDWTMTDYAAAHGFNLVQSYNAYRQAQTHLPAGTGYLSMGWDWDWDKWLPAHNVPVGRFDLLADLDVAKTMYDEGFLKDQDATQWAGIMIDMEHGCLRPVDLRKQDWYPKDGTPDAQAAFEKKYYHGYAQTQYGPVEAAHKRGFKNVSFYGWQPFARTWGLGQVQVGGPDDWLWNMFGQEVYSHVDIINNSVYCFYWMPQNVAYTLASTDLNMQLVNSRPQHKPVRPYFWTLLAGGGGGWRWWANQALPTEDERAMIAMNFFTGDDGFDTWNFSGVGNHQVPPVPTKAMDLVFKDSFEAPVENPAAGAEEKHTFERYDAVHVLSVDDQGTARFQLLDMSGYEPYGITPDKPVYLLNKDELRGHVRTPAEPVAAMIEGLALVYPFENILRHGEVKIDVPAQLQFAQALPIVRRVKQGKIHILITYDPKVIFGGEPRSIVLNDFDGHAGLTVTLPADSETRIWALQEK